MMAPLWSPVSGFLSLSRSVAERGGLRSALCHYGPVTYVTTGDCGVLPAEALRAVARSCALC